MTAKRDAIRAIYAQVSAPPWASANLDGLADVLRDLSWLAEGPIRIAVPDVSGLIDDERSALREILDEAVAQRAGTSRPIELTGFGGG